jgi:hypothetical protein
MKLMGLTTALQTGLVALERRELGILHTWVDCTTRHAVLMALEGPSSNMARRHDMARVTC